MTPDDQLARERRARLAAERLLDQRMRELFAANEKLGLHARALAEQVVEQRGAVKSARDEAALLKGQNDRVLGELAEAHAAAVTAEQRLWDSIDIIRDGFAVFDATQRLVMTNRAYAVTFSDFSLAPGTSYAELIENLATGDLVMRGDEAPGPWTKRMLARLDADAIPPETLRFTDGSWRKLVDRRARNGDLVSVMIDITDQMRIWAGIEAMPDAFVLFDRDERLLALNERYREMFPASADALRPGIGYEDILRKVVDAHLVPDAIGREEEWLAERLQRMRDAPTITEVQLADGRWIREREHPTPDGGRVSICSDITRARDQQAALEEANRAARAANRAKSAFLANMSHEIRTPMNGVIGMAELLSDTALTEEQRLLVETIRSSGEALLVIINDILDYSRIEAGRMALRHDSFDLERIIHQVILLLQPQAHARDIDLLIDYDVFLPTRFVGDPGRMRQILTNLIGNAVKFTEKGRVLTRVVGIEIDDHRVQLHVTVEDTGIGIARADQERIFAEFDRVETEASRNHEGTGLGLAITRHLVQLMGGNIWVESAPGQGATFGFRITLAPAEPSAADPPPTTIRRALVIGDQVTERTILERQLSLCGIGVTPCRSAEEGLALLARGADFDIALVDQDMPGTDGLTLAARLRATGNLLPIILLAANPAGIPAGASGDLVGGVLQKPVLRADLYREMARMAPAATPPAAPRSLPRPPHVPQAVPVQAPPTPPTPVPSTSPSDAPPADQASPPRRLHFASRETRPMRVLVAEDNRTNQLVLRKMLERLGADILLAANGHEALALWRAQEPDAILMDISMPGMDGKAAARAIREAEEPGRHVPIIALTAHAMAGDAADILAAGIDEYLAKPVRKAALRDALRAHCPADARLAPDADPPDAPFGPASPDA